MINDLQAFIIKLVGQHDEVLLMWDANTSMKNAALNRMFTSIDMYNLMPDTPDAFSTYMRGRQIIDHIWDMGYRITP
jgi:hypothetical protein